MESTLIDSFIDVNQFFNWTPSSPDAITGALILNVIHQLHR